jgi:hypothetical protein
MSSPEDPTSRAELAARWRADAQVFRRYGSTGRARMLERLAAELDRVTSDESAAEVDLTTAAERTGFTRGHLRRLYRNGRLVAVRFEDGEPLFRVADLPRKPSTTGRTEDVVRAVVGERRVSRMFPRD